MPLLKYTSMVNGYTKYVFFYKNYEVYIPNYYFSYLCTMYIKLKRFLNVYAGLDNINLP